MTQNRWFVNPLNFPMLGTAFPPFGDSFPQVLHRQRLGRGTYSKMGGIEASSCRNRALRSPLMANRLARSTSPYLLQHAENPVDWFEWGDEAFAEARRRQVPILLSVGYSACHWCHVMAHESFEDPVTAGEMNTRFVNVKVDREERPDVDATYMEAVQTMTGHGGWPMTVFLTPDLEPFFAGTYFPRDDRQGMPSFRRVMVSLSEAWEERRADVLEQAGRVTNAISIPLTPGAELASPEAVINGYRALVASFEPVHGGFGGAPKFPQSPALEFLLRTWHEPWAAEGQAMLHKTLQAMADGGIHDHLAGGFARYSVDDHWLVPHFEKMLYDNALLARIYMWAGIEFGDVQLLEVARSTFDYLLTDLRHPEGGFYSAEDADSEGVEGKFYVWSLDEFNEVATGDAPLGARHFGVTRAGNFDGHNILHKSIPLEQAAAELGIDEGQARQRILELRSRLLERRRTRVRPGLDDKVIASWNGFAIRALAEAGAGLDEPRYLEAARKAARFVLDQMRTPEGGLVRAWAKGHPSRVAGFLDDYSAVATGFLSLYAATSEVEWFEAARSLLGQLAHRFGDESGGFFTAEETGELPKRPKDVFDNPAPSGNALAAEALLTLALYTGEDGPRRQATETLRGLGVILERYPTGGAYALSVLHTIHRGTHELAIVGSNPAELARVFWRRLRPHVALAVSTFEETRVPLLVDRFFDSATLAYLCSGFTCLAPVSTVTELEAALASV